MKFKKLLILVTFTICFSSGQTFACLQVNGSPVVGKRIEIEGIPADEFMRTFVTHEDRAFWEKLKAEINSQKESNPRLEWRNNLAVVLVHLGEIPEALKLLEELEKESPGGYFTAANLGTAYELSGQNQKALDWIKEGIKRNSQSHRGTEWLHVKILEAKLAIEKDANWLKNNSVLGADFKTVGATDFLGRQKSSAEIETALVYQLHERLEFVKPPEPIVADLLFDLSKVFAVTRTPQHAGAINDLALNYAGISKEPVKNGIIEKNEIFGIGTRTYYHAIPAVVVFALVGLIYFFLRRRNYN